MHGCRVSFSHSGFELILDLTRGKIYNASIEDKVMRFLISPARTINRVILPKNTVLAFAIVLLGFLPSVVKASEVPNELKDVGIIEHLDEQLPLSDYTFKNEMDQPVKLS